MSTRGSYEIIQQRKFIQYWRPQDIIIVDAVKP